LKHSSAEHTPLPATKHRGIQQGPELTSHAEMIEMTRKANTYLKECAIEDATANITEANVVFLTILRAQRAQQPAPPAKELCYTYNKLRYTSYQLSQLHSDAGQRMKLIDAAARYGQHAIKYAIDSGNDHRVAQMRFYHACVLAQKVKLAAEEQRFQTPTELERDNARGAIEEAWTMLESIKGSDMGPYHHIKARTLDQLLPRS
jgi:hypothetical protein